MAYPTSLDSFTDPSGSNKLNSPSHSELHSAKNTAIEALEAKLGINSSAVATSIDYFLKHASGAFRTHKHDGTSDDGAKLDWDDIWSDAVHSHASAAEGGTLDWDNVWADAVHTHANDAEGGTIPEASVVFGATGHDHTGTTAGNLIPTAGIEDSAINSDKIAAKAVIYSKIDINVGARVSLSADQDNLVNNVWTKVLLDTEQYDLANNFAAYKYVVGTGEDGYYDIKGSVMFEGAELNATGEEFAVAIYVNNAPIKIDYNHSVQANALSISVADTYHLAATDYVELFVLSGNGDNLADLESGTAQTVLSVFFLSK
jgi:hypothetical protein